MEFFTKSSTVRLRSHLDKHLASSPDHLGIRQSRRPTRHTLWRVEPVPDLPALIRLKNLHTQKYLTASASAILLGVAGKRVIQTLNPHSSPATCWEPVRDGFQVKLRSAGGTFLRANGGAAPWRNLWKTPEDGRQNSVTHDSGSSRGVKGWVLWDVESVEVGEVKEYLSSLSSFGSSALDDDEDGSEPVSPMSVISYESPSFFSFRRSGMDLFRNAAAVRLRSHHDKYLTAEEDKESVTQERSGSSKDARWVVELVPSADNVIRLKSSYGKYLTASNQPFLLGMTGRKVLQTVSERLDSSVEWVPVREGSQVKLKTRYGNFLRANGGLPPWRNSVTHDVPHRSATQEWVLWDVETLETQTPSPPLKAAISDPPQSPPSSRSESFASSGSFSITEGSEHGGRVETKMEGRTVYYHIASDEYGEVGGDGNGGFAMVFGGTSVEELTRRLEEETGLEDIVVCTKSPLNQKLYPLRLQLPPNITMHVVVVPRDSEVARELAKSGTIL